ncbi:hypothetical protein M422DRAFT_269409 [Sphaerobolus stellatus SS14]|uniref:Protein kinase domain-containing protein n=1 Tax=Sphaerobolus stellatus (strain SS14) TaxID=990650 RepID=A0A0C9UV84_SPHS4|nr:hypothetical protein M422DRAFT_269409 [Sphaerobolus stellatus SS14]
MSMGSLQELFPPLQYELPPMPSVSPSLSSISTSSDDAPQLSFEYHWDDEGNYHRVSKRSPEEKTVEQDILAAIEEPEAQPNTNHVLLNDLLGNDRTAENPQSIASVLSRSRSASASQDFLSVAPPSARPFGRTSSTPAVPLSGRSSLLTATDRPMSRARRVQIPSTSDAKRKEEAEVFRRIEHDKENWAGGQSYGKVAEVPLSSSLTRTQSDPSPHLPEQPEAPLHPQPIENVPGRQRRPMSKQQRVLGAVSRPSGKESLARTSGGSSDIRSISNSVEGSPQEDSRLRAIMGGARRITKEERERQEREAEEIQANLERQQHEQERLEMDERERELKAEEQRMHEEAARLRELEAVLEQERERYARPHSALSQRQADPEERQRERPGITHPTRVFHHLTPFDPTGRFSHQRRDSETVMPEAAPLPPRMSPSARNVTARESNANANTGLSTSHETQADYPPGLNRSRSGSISYTHATTISQTQLPLRAQHRRSPTAPEAHHHTNGSMSAKTKTWAMGDLVGEVDRDLGGLGPIGEAGVREKEAYRETRVAQVPVPPPAPVQQVTGAKNFMVNGRTYGKLDMIGKGGSSRVYRVITPSNEIYALKRVSLDRTDQETMQGYMNEIALLRRLDGNDRIIRLIESEVRGGSKGHLMLVMECGEVDLARLISARQSCPLDMVWVSYYWKQMLEAVQVIHEEKIVHSDLKPANFVLVKGELKLIDFGIANAIANDTTNIQRDHQIGTVNYMSPESIEVAEGNNRLKVGRPSDVWSLGCILYQMIYGTPPFHALSVLQKMRVIPDPNNIIDYPTETVPIVPQPRSMSSGNASTPPKKLFHLARPVPMEVIESLRSCLAKTPKERETIPQLLTAGWLHPRGRSEEMRLATDEVIIDKDLLRQVVSWAITVGMSTGMPKEDEFEDTLEQTLAQLQSCQRKR